ncbi:DUF2129 domain-containing protein [Staphylococcus auricularis]|uniref:DUF2129 domain-containing protein n=1 Tax=Staphylococcus auricularis TaxID=29379 RepID=UPI003EB7C640
MDIVQRTSLIIYLKHIKHERQLRKYGHIVHINRNHKYVIMYVNANDADSVITRLSKLKYVKHISSSPYKYLTKTYEKERHETS